MATAKVTINNRTIMDITDTTATAETIRQGYTAYRADGVKVTGTYTGGGGGIDLPTFTVTETNGVKTVTCDKTYAQCSTFLRNGVIRAIGIIDGGTAEVSVTKFGMNSGNIIYSIAAATGKPMGDIAYASSGVITYHEPSELINLDECIVIPDETYQVITPSGSEDGFNVVRVQPISSYYIGSDIPYRYSTDLTASGATVTVPSGYYSEAASKSVDTMTLPTSASASATSGYTSKATISRSTSDQYINIPTGYNTAGGYYKINAVANGSVTAPSSISGTSASVSTGTNTLTLTKTVSVTPNVTTAGYISSGTAGNSSVSLTASVTVNPTPTASGKTVTIPAGYYSSQTTKDVSTGSATAPASISGTSATVSTGTNTLTLSKTVSVTPSVTAGYISSGTAGNASVSLTANVTTKGAATITPTTTNQTIASGTYLTGTQTISGDADLVASNIISTANIFGVQGSVVINKYYTGSSAPSSSLGSNGDIYLQS